MRIGIILGSTRDGRVGESVAHWINGLAQARDSEAVYELVDLKDYDLPFFTGAVPPKGLDMKYTDPKVTAWSDKINSFSGYLFVTAEYNRSAPAPFKNAFDTLADEWQGKALAFAGYGYVGGVNSVKTWRQIVGAFRMQVVEQALSFNLRHELPGGVFTPAEGQEEAVSEVLSALESTTAEVIAHRSAADA